MEVEHIGLLITRNLLILLGNQTTKRDKTESLGYNLATILVHFPALFFRQFAFCAAEIFFLVAALIFLLALTRLPPSAVIAATTPSRLSPDVLFLLERGQNVHEASARILP